MSHSTWKDSGICARAQRCNHRIQYGSRGDSQAGTKAHYVQQPAGQLGIPDGAGPHKVSGMRTCAEAASGALTRTTKTRAHLACNSERSKHCTNRPASYVEAMSASLSVMPLHEQRREGRR